jgi:hypothetical protein
MTDKTPAQQPTEPKPAPTVPTQGQQAAQRTLDRILGR